MFADRFGRQKGCGFPPEFPLASIYSGMVHYLSVITATLSLESRHGVATDRWTMRRTNGSRLGGPCHLHCAFDGFHHPNYCCTPFPCFKTGRMQPTASQAQSVSDPPIGATADAGHCTQRHGAADEQTRASRPRVACATVVEMPPLSSAFAGCSARLAIWSPLPGAVALPSRRNGSRWGWQPAKCARGP